MKKKHAMIDDEIKNFILISGIVILIVLGFFWLTSIRINKPYKPTIPKQESETEISYSKILMGSILTRPEENYYVYVKKSENPYYKLLLDMNEKKYRYYEVDLNSFFNKGYLAETSSQVDLKFAGDTILAVSGGKIVEFLDNKEKIEAYFKISKEESWHNAICRPKTLKTFFWLLF